MAIEIYPKVDRTGSPVTSQIRPRHATDTTNVHGIPDTLKLISRTDDPDDIGKVIEASTGQPFSIVPEGIDVRLYAAAGATPDDWTDAIQLALAERSIYDAVRGDFNRGLLKLPRRVTLTEALIIDAATTGLIGHHGGTSMDLSALDGSVAITVRGSGNDEIEGTVAHRQATRPPLYGISFKGSGRNGNPSTVGVKFITPGNNQDSGTRQGATAYSMVEHCAFTDLYKGVSFDSNAYCIGVYNCLFARCNVAFQGELASANAGESYKIIASTIGDCDYGVVSANAGAVIDMYSSSVDYCSTRLLYANKGKITMHGGHLEHDGTNEWFQTDDFTAGITLNDVRLALAGSSRTTPLATVPASSGLGGITINGGFFSFSSAPTTSVLFDGDGPTRAGRAPTYRFAVGGKAPALARQLSVVLGDIDATTLASWTPTAGGGAAAPSLDATTGYRGTSSIKFAAVGTAGTAFMFRKVPASPGQIVSGSFWAKTGGTYAANSFALSIFLASGPSTYVPPFQSYPLAITANWTQYQLGPFVVPAGVDALQFQFGAAYSVGTFPAGSTINVDDIVLNVV